MDISIFGGSQTKEGAEDYSKACELGRLLAEAGHTVITGGYIGTMEAVSRGAFKAGGNVVGVTCEEIEKWRQVKANRWIKEERRFTTLQERLNELIIRCDAAMALPGGPGTLTEVALTWNLMIIDAIPKKPLILIGDGWESVINRFYNSFNTYIPKDQRSLLYFAYDNSEAINHLSLIQK